MKLTSIFQTDEVDKHISKTGSKQVPSGQEATVTVEQSMYELHVLKGCGIRLALFDSQT